MTGTFKGVEFLGDSLRQLRNFPESARQAAGYQIHRVQAGQSPLHFRTMPSIGPGVSEIKIREDNGQFRVFYLANQKEVVYILHCCQKKTQKTARNDLELAKQRFQSLPI